MSDWSMTHCWRTSVVVGIGRGPVQGCDCPPCLVRRLQQETAELELRINETERERDGVKQQNAELEEALNNARACFGGGDPAAAESYIRAALKKYKRTKP